MAEAALGLGVLLALASLPWFPVGVWDKAEPLVIGLHLSAALAASALALAGGEGARALATPPALLCLALALWSALTLPFTPLPLLSLAGTVQSGLGVFWHLDFALLIGAARLLGGRPEALGRVRRLGILVVAACAGLKAWDFWAQSRGLPHLLLWIPAYYAWLGIGLGALILAGERHRFWRMAGLVAALAALLIGRSLAAWLAVGLASLLAVILPRLPETRSRSLGIAACGVAALAPPLILTLVPASRKLASLDDRFSLLKMLWAEFQQWPVWRWLTGLGWGRTQDVLAGNLEASGQTLWDDSWIFMTSDYFHSHNAQAEALLAAGIPGVLLSLAMIAAIPWSAGQEKRPLASAFAAAASLFGALWFPLAFWLPMAALAIAALIPPMTRSSPESREQSPHIRALLAVTALGCLGLTLALWQQGRDHGMWRAFLAGESKEQMNPPSDWRGSDQPLAASLREALARYEVLPPNQRDEAGTRIQTIVTALAARVPSTQTPRLIEAGLMLLAQIRVTRGLEWLEQRLPDLDRIWTEWAEAGLRLSPRRTDLLIPMLADLARQGRFTEMTVWTDALLRLNPNDPVGLYHLALLHLVSDLPHGRRDGIHALKASIEAGIGRFIPLSPDVLSLAAEAGD